MSYFLSQKPDNYCPVEEREQASENIVNAMSQDRGLFDSVMFEVYSRRAGEMQDVLYEIYKFASSSHSMDSLIDAVVEECLMIDINFFGDWR